MNSSGKLQLVRKAEVLVFECVRCYFILPAGELALSVEKFRIMWLIADEVSHVSVCACVCVEEGEVWFRQND